MIVLLPEGRAVCNPDNIKLVKVVHSEVQGKRTFVVIVKLDDDSELMVKTLNAADEAYALANQCADLINTSEGGDGDSDDNSDEDDSDEDDDSFRSGLPASKEQSVKGTPSASESDSDSESALTQAASKTDAGSKAKQKNESSDWDNSSEDESSSWVFASAEEESKSEEEESKSSDWDSASHTPASKSSVGGSSKVGGTSSVASKKEQDDDSSDWSMSVESPKAAHDDDSSSDWFSDDGFSAPVTSSIAKERHDKQFPKPVPQPPPVVEIRTPSPAQKHDDSLEDSDDWFIDDGNDDWY